MLVLPRAAGMDHEAVPPVVPPHLAGLPPVVRGRPGPPRGHEEPGGLVGRVLPVLGALPEVPVEFTLNGIEHMTIQFSVTQASCTMVGSSSWNQSSLETLPCGSTVYTQTSGVTSPFAS